MLRQSLFGGDLATNLLELSSIDEATLLSATAATLEVVALPNGPIPIEDSDLLGSFAVTQLLEVPFVPLLQNESELIVASAAPLPNAVAEELRNRFNKPVVLRAALEIRIRQAIARSLSQSLDDRTNKLLARLDGVPYESKRDGAVAQRNSSVTPSPRTSMPAGRRSLLPLHRDAKPHGQSRRLGPLTAAMAEIELTSAQSPGDIIGVWLDFVSQYFDYAAIFAVQGDIAAGKLARGNGTVGEAFSRIGVPLDLPSALQRVRVVGTWQLTALEPRGLDRTLARDLGRSTGPQVLLLPINIKQRVVLLTYGDHGDDDVLLDRVGDVLALQPLVERNLERLLVERKRGGRSLQPAAIRSIPAGGASATRPEAHQTDTAGASVGAEQDAGNEAKPPASADARAASNESSLVADAAAATKPAATGASGTTQATSTETGSRSSHSAANTDSIDDSWDLIQPVLTAGDGDAMRQTRAATNIPTARQLESSPPGSVWPSQGTRPGLSPKLELLSDADTSIGIDAGPPPPPPPPPPDEPLLPAARAESHAPHVLARASESKEMALPSVVVNYENDCLALLESFKTGDASALDALLEMGDAAIGVLARQLPGPVSTPSRAPRSDQAVKASECGPVLRALAAFGSAARPFVIARTSDGDSKVRVWSTRLLGELVGPASAVAVAQRIVLDRDAEVRRAAYLASHQLLRDKESAQALREALLATAGDRRAVITHRLSAIDALADLRDAPAIPNLIELLADPNPGTAAAAQQALSVLARQDFGYDARTWSAWWKSNSGRDRIEWVIDALDHRAPSIRQAASEELRLISRLYVGNFDEDSTETRAKVQKKYRDWWAAGARSPSGPVRS